MYAARDSAMGRRTRSSTPAVTRNTRMLRSSIASRETNLRWASVSTMPSPALPDAPAEVATAAAPPSSPAAPVPSFNTPSMVCDSQPSSPVVPMRPESLSCSNFSCSYRAPAPPRSRLGANICRWKLATSTRSWSALKNSQASTRGRNRAGQSPNAPSSVSASAAVVATSPAPSAAATADSSQCCVLPLCTGASMAAMRPPRNLTTRSTSAFPNDPAAMA
mmetsp:Transcript_26626/g.92547  ORF Transcript_26626/g.92547 Transcript_26626/m.92547 type:complete len:220 (-) Transcript_26626:72-731(-)